MTLGLTRGSGPGGRRLSARCGPCDVGPTRRGGRRDVQAFLAAVVGERAGSAGEVGEREHQRGPAGPADEACRRRGGAVAGPEGPAPSAAPVASATSQPARALAAHRVSVFTLNHDVLVSPAVRV
jgi:hypothetical protein